MKTSKFTLSPITSLVLVFILAIISASCGTKSSHKEMDEHAQDSVHHDEEEGHHDDHKKESTTSSDSIMWMPDDQPFEGLFKLVKGNAKKLDATVLTADGGAKALSLTLSGNQVVLLFDGLLENIGSNLQFKAEGFQGKVVIVHHYVDEFNYDYLALSNTSMQLGRIENGKDNVLDKKDEKMPVDWAKLTVSAAGEHYKGSLNDKLVNHGHAEIRPAGRVGLILEGKGKVMLKMMEVMKLTE